MSPEKNNDSNNNNNSTIMNIHRQAKMGLNLLCYAKTAMCMKQSHIFEKVYDLLVDVSRLV